LSTTNPYDPMCGRFARDMPELDNAWPMSEEELNRVPEDERGDLRAYFIITNDGTFNPDNGHFLCMGCYIQAGMPVAPHGWVCP